MAKDASIGLRLLRWYNRSYRPYGGWRSWFHTRWLYYGRHLFPNVYVSSSKGLDTSYSGSKDFPFRTLAAAAESIKNRKGRIRFRLRGQDVWEEEFPIISKTPKYLWIEPYGEGRPTIKCRNGVIIDRHNTFLLSLNVYIDRSKEWPVTNLITVPTSNGSICWTPSNDLSKNSTEKKSLTEAPGRNEKESELS